MLDELHLLMNKDLGAIKNIFQAAKNIIEEIDEVVEDIATKEASSIKNAAIDAICKILQDQKSV